jgi:hypothetical protein
MLTATENASLVNVIFRLKQSTEVLRRYLEFIGLIRIINRGKMRVGWCRTPRKRKNDLDFSVVSGVRVHPISRIAFYF